ncbi:hypothetical protein GMLC_07350 [Geomonas limicola]|uniref:Tetratricopeptide repeat protein n=1 Tax=Geomonas limicola TaxID=2740186 RepID=A0A6V8N3R3_9BACT|nr:tetratricopeptide repeat protein [Geomonas limicola]GFO67156.1 hypothetical protein GMLC_07350 [Geomonas limicola]
MNRFSAAGFGLTLLAAVSATAAPTLYTGEIAVMRVSGTYCASDVYERLPQIDLVLDRSGDGTVTGFYSIEGVKVGKLSGPSPDRLSVEYPIADPARSKGHTLSLDLAKDPVSGILQEKGLAEKAEGCAIEVGEVRLSPVPDEDAADWFKRTEKSYQAQALSSEALSFMKKDQPAKAIPLYREALALEEAAQGAGSPLSILYVDQLANAYGKSRQPDQGIALLEPRVEQSQDPEKRFYSEALARLLQMKGATFSREGRYSEALPVYRRAMTLDPSESDYPAGLARTLIKLNRIEEAAALLDEVTPLFTEENDREELNRVRRELKAAKKKP